MSANIYWEPADRPAETVPAGAPQSFMKVLGHLGWRDGDTLNETELPALRALEEDYGNRDGNPFTVLVEAIEKHGSIRVWAQY